MEQPPKHPDAPWHQDPALKGHFHPECPDDLQALFFFPETKAKEKIWVRLHKVAEEIQGYQGELLNQPHSTDSLKKGEFVYLRKSPGLPKPVYVSPSMKEDLIEWTMCCQQCGFDMLFHPVKQLAARQFPDAPMGSVPIAFGTRCPLCKQAMLVELKEAKGIVSDPASNQLDKDVHFSGTFSKPEGEWQEAWFPLQGTGELQFQEDGMYIKGPKAQHNPPNDNFFWAVVLILGLGLLTRYKLYPELHPAFLFGACTILVGLARWWTTPKQQNHPQENESYIIPWDNVIQIMQNIEMPKVVIIEIKHHKPEGFLHFAPDRGAQALLTAFRHRQKLLHLLKKEQSKNTQ